MKSVHLLLGFVGTAAIAMAACRSDIPTATLANGQTAKVFSYVYLCELGYVEYADYCSDFGSAAHADSLWRRYTHWMDSLRTAEDSLYSIFVGRGYVKIQTMISRTEYEDPNDCHAYYLEAAAMYNQGPGYTGHFDNTQFVFTNADGSTNRIDAVTDWSDGKWAFSDQDFARDFYRFGGSGGLIGDDMLHEVVHDADNTMDETYVTQRVADCSVNTPNLRASSLSGRRAESPARANFRGRYNP